MLPRRLLPPAQAGRLHPPLERFGVERSRERMRWHRAVGPERGSSHNLAPQFGSAARGGVLEAPVLPGAALLYTEAAREPKPSQAAVARLA